MAGGKKKAASKVVRPGKDIVASMADGFREKLLKAVKEDVKELVIDLKGVDMIDSVGIGVLLATYNSMSNAGGKLRLRNVSKDIYALFKMMRLDQHFEIKPATPKQGLE